MQLPATRPLFLFAFLGCAGLIAMRSTLNMLWVSNRAHSVMYNALLSSCLE